MVRIKNWRAVGLDTWQNIHTRVYLIIDYNKSPEIPEKYKVYLKTPYARHNIAYLSDIQKAKRFASNYMRDNP